MPETSTTKDTAAPPPAGRCVFANHCLCVRLLGLPAGPDVSPCFAGCIGMVMVSHGLLEIETASGRRMLREGESRPLPPAEPSHVLARENTDVLLFEKISTESPLSK